MKDSERLRQRLGKVASRDLAWGMRTLLADLGHWVAVTQGRALSASSGSLSGGGSDPRTAPIKMLHDRLLVEVDQEAGERRSTGGIVIPATAAMGARRLA